jgi:hypothetical protein
MRERWIAWRARSDDASTTPSFRDAVLRDTAAPGGRHAGGFVSSFVTMGRA